MTMSVPERISESGGKEEESEDESEILEESPCGRWQKRKEQVCPLLLHLMIMCLHPLQTHTQEEWLNMAYIYLIPPKEDHRHADCMTASSSSSMIHITKNKPCKRTVH